MCVAIAALAIGCGGRSSLDPGVLDSTFGPSVGGAASDARGGAAGSAMLGAGGRSGSAGLAGMTAGGRGGDAVQGGAGTLAATCGSGTPTWSCAPAEIAGACCDPIGGAFHPACFDVCPIEDSPEGHPCGTPGETVTLPTAEGRSKSCQSGWWACLVSTCTCGCRTGATATVPGLAETCDRAVFSNAYDYPLYLTVSGEFVYWITTGLCPNPEDWIGTGKLFGARQSDGSAAMVIPDLPCPAELAVVGEDLYWTNNPGIPATRSIWTARIDGSGARLLIDDTYASRLLADSDNLYFIEDERIRKVARDGNGPPAELAMIVGLTAETQEALAIDDRYVYWIDSPTFEDGSVNRVSKLGGEPETLATTRRPVALTSSPDGLFWFDAPPQQPINLYGLPWQGTGPSLLASVDDHSHALAAVDGHVYWADGLWPETGNVYGLAVSGGDPVVLAQGEPTAIVLAADQQYLFWTTMASESIIDKGEVVRLCR